MRSGTFNCFEVTRKNMFQDSFTVDSELLSIDLPPTRQKLVTCTNFAIKFPLEALIEFSLLIY